MDATGDTGVRTEGGLMERRQGARDARAPADSRVRDEDLEPHEGLRYIARLFKVLAILLVLLLIGEMVLGFSQQGAQAIPTLLVEATRLIVFACFLWGAGDFALMQIESNHDQRAVRILIGRMNGKLQRMAELEEDELEMRAANPGMRRGEQPRGAP